MSLASEVHNCTFCGKSQHEVAVLYRGRVNVCDECLLRSWISMAENVSDHIESEDDLKDVICSFCSKRSIDVARIVQFGRGNNLCFDCTSGLFEMLLSDQKRK